MESELGKMADSKVSLPEERYPYLKFMLADYINTLCEQNHLDTTLLKTKEEKIAALQMLPDLKGTVFGSGSEYVTTTKKNINKLKGFRQLGPDDDVECYLATFKRHCLSQEIPVNLNDGHWI